MRAEVRDDIIGLDSFVVAKFKLEKYIQMIKDSGNYCFLDQFKRLFKNGEYIATQLEESNLIKTATLNNNYKYIYITDTAMKYLTLKDDPRDFSKVKKSSISVAKVNKYPSEKVLISSALKFNFISQAKNEIFIKDNLLKSLENEYCRKYEVNDTKADKGHLQEQINSLKDKCNEEQKLKENIYDIFKEIQGMYSIISSIKLNNLRLENNEEINLLDKELQNLKIFDKKRKLEIENRINQLKITVSKLDIRISMKTKIEEQEKKINDKIINLNKEILNKENELEIIIKKEQEQDENIEFKKLKNKVINLYDKSKIIPVFYNDILQFCILDTGNTKTAFGYLKIINELKELYDFKILRVFICSYSKKRAESLKAELEETQKEKSKALKRMESYKQKCNLDRLYRNSWREPSKNYLNAEQIYYNTPSIERIALLESVWYMESYKKNISSSKSYIKEKDKNAIKDLKERLKK